ncbi:SAM-dependent methyltransferase [Microbacterium fluvii]|uniref:SAM-dependent methyltransferase n=1 Tax=Microbacterium fluvii TaxID=415215 RepID=A0ABW2HC43_9MICO|nr:class I SAM-dependent methyltransferase [Microbacterium fluvii]MCU4671224.1 SAM-dependent methyltransferase [Microbacterium fluvii]
MDLAELTALLTPEGLQLLDDVGGISSTDEVARAVTRLRAEGHSPDLVSAVVGQARLREKARPKFGGFAERMLFTRAGLEQSTRLSVAARHAGRIRDAGFTAVADLGCGIGGDALGFAALGLRVQAVDADEVTAAIAAYNLAPFGADATVAHGTAEAFVAGLAAASAASAAALADGADRDPASAPKPSPDAPVSSEAPGLDGRSPGLDATGPDEASRLALWLDPARRTAGHSETARTRPEDWSPSLDWVFEVAARHPVGVKLGPGLDRALIPDDVEAQWVSADGSTIELVLWSGALARPGVRRAALVIRGERAWELTAPADAPDAEVRELGAYLHEPDGAVIRARLIGEVAGHLQAGMLDEHIAYLTGDEPLTSPFAQSFRVREVLPTGVKPLAAALKAAGIGTLEIKKRGVDIDPAALRKQLKLRGPESATLFLTRIGSRRVAVLADRV